MDPNAAQAAPTLDQQIEAKKAEFLNASGQAETLGRELQALQDLKAHPTPANLQGTDLVAYLLGENTRLNQEVLRLTGELAAEKLKNTGLTPAPANNGPQSERNEPNVDHSGEELHFTEDPIGYLKGMALGSPGQKVMKRKA